MCFENLYESSERGELLLVDGAMCHWWTNVMGWRQRGHRLRR